MLVEWLVRANLWAERHRTLVAAVTVAAFALSCAHYARFIRLPEIVALPVVATGLLTGLRYALWDGWLKRRVEARSAAIRDGLGGQGGLAADGRARRADPPTRRPACADSARGSRGTDAPGSAGEGGSAGSSEVP